MRYVIAFVMVVSLLAAVFGPALASDEMVMVELVHDEEVINYMMSGSIEGDAVIVTFDMGDSLHNYRFGATGGTVNFSASVTFPAHMTVEEVSATAIQDGAEREVPVILMSSISSTPAPTRVPPTPVPPTATVQPTLTPFVPTPTITATPQPTATATQPSPLPTITLLPWPTAEPTLAPQYSFHTFLPLVVTDHHSGEQE